MKLAHGFAIFACILFTAMALMMDMDYKDCKDGFDLIENEVCVSSEGTFEEAIVVKVNGYRSAFYSLVGVVTFLSLVGLTLGD